MGEYNGSSRSQCVSINDCQLFIYSVEKEYLSEQPPMFLLYTIFIWKYGGGKEKVELSLIFHFNGGRLYHRAVCSFHQVFAV